MKLSILGAGAWGTAAAIHCSAQHEVLLWTRSELHAQALQQDRVNQTYLPGPTLPASIEITANLEAALAHVANGAGVAILATPCSGLVELSPAIIRAQPEAILNLAKGLLPNGLLPHQLVKSDVPFASVFGPSFAIEIAQGMPAAVTAASTDPRAQAAAIAAFHSRYLRVYGSDDAVGVELAGALKNVVAIAAGASDGVLLGFNARAALITRGLAEIARIGVAMGAQASTFQGLSGMGDLLLTCTGPLSRNRVVGLRLAGGESLGEIEAALGHVAEGVRSALAAKKLAADLNIDAPIITAVNQMLFEGLPIARALENLMDRAQRDEV